MDFRASVMVGSAIAVIVGCALPAVACGQSLKAHAGNSTPSTSTSVTAANFELEVAGRTRSISGRVACISPVPLHPVVGVLVSESDRVKKGQPLVKLDDDEPRAAVLADEAVLDGACIAVAEANRCLAAAEKSYHDGGFSEQRYFEVRTDALKAEATLRGAQAALDGSRAKLDLYVVKAAIDGVVDSLEVHLGAVSRPGTTIWGEILDLREIDVHCEVTPGRADRLAAGQAVELLSQSGEKAEEVGRDVVVGGAADQVSELIPVIVRFPNDSGRLRSKYLGAPSLRDRSRELFAFAILPTPPFARLRW